MPIRGLKMEKSDQNNPKTDTSIEFRKCWALGEAYYVLSACYHCNQFEKINKNICSKPYSNQDSKFYKFYRSRLEGMRRICESFEIYDINIKDFLDKLRNELDGLKIRKINKCNFDIEFEDLLIGNLMGKDPRYEHVFRAAKHCQGLYNCNEKDIKHFLSDLESLKNFVSRDKRELIKDIVNDWDNVKIRYKKLRLTKRIEKKEMDLFKKLDNEHKIKCDIRKLKKELNDVKKKKNNELLIDKFEKPELTGIIFRIGGLILGVTQVKDVLKREDRFLWVLVCYVFLILFFVFIITIVILNLVNHPEITSKLIFWINSQNVLEFKDYLIYLGAVASFSLYLIKGGRTIWIKFADWFEFKLAVGRLKYPNGWRTKILFFIIINNFKFYSWKITKHLNSYD